MTILEYTGAKNKICSVYLVFPHTHAPRGSAVRVCNVAHGISKDEVDLGWEVWPSPPSRDYVLKVCLGRDRKTDEERHREYIGCTRARPGRLLRGIVDQQL